MGTTSTDRPRYWFPAKQLGWGWGPPATWQGWTVMAVWIVTLSVGASLITPQRPLAFVAFMLVAAAALVAVCYAKGEPPRWR